MNLRVETDGAVATITMDAPEKLNAMGRTFWPDLRDALSTLETDGRTRAVVITGAGEKAFSAGGDIASFAELDGAAAKREFQRDCMRTFCRGRGEPAADRRRGQRLRDGRRAASWPWPATSYWPPTAPCSRCRRRRSGWCRGSACCGRRR